MKQEIRKNQFIPIALCFGHYPNFGFLVLPHNNLFSCKITRKQKSGDCIISAASTEDAKSLFPYAGNNSSDKTVQESEIIPLTFSKMWDVLSPRSSDNVTLITSTTEHKGQSCQPSTLVRPFKELKTNLFTTQSDQQTQKALLSFHQQTLFQTMFCKYGKEYQYRSPKLSPHHAMSVEELLMIDYTKWFDPDHDDALPNQYEISGGTINDRGPIRAVKIIDYPIQHGTIELKL